MRRRIIKVIASVLTAVLFMQVPMTQAAERIGILYTNAFMLEGNEECQVYRAHVSSLDKTTCYQILGTDYVRYEYNGKELPSGHEFVPVTVLGMPEEKNGGVDPMSKKAVYINLFGRMIEPWEDYVAPAGDPLSWINVKLQTLILPGTVKKIEPAAFAKMPDLKTVHLPQGLAALEKFTFFGCGNLEEVVFPESIRINDATVFMGCKKLKGLVKRTKDIKKTLLISYEKNLVMDYGKKNVIQVMPTTKQITIPVSVEKIEPLAFAGTNLKQVKVEKGNKTFAVSGRSLYNKKNGKLVLAFGTGSKLTLSKKIKKIDKNSMVAKYKVKKLVMPKKLKRTNGWKKPFIENNEKIKIYYRGKRIR